MAHAYFGPWAANEFARVLDLCAHVCERFGQAGEGRDSSWDSFVYFSVCQSFVCISSCVGFLHSRPQLFRIYILNQNVVFGSCRDSTTANAVRLPCASGLGERFRAQFTARLSPKLVKWHSPTASTRALPQSAYPPSIHKYRPPLLATRSIGTGSFPAQCAATRLRT